MTSPGGINLTTLWVNVAPSLSGMTESMKKGGAQAADAFAGEFHARTGPGMGEAGKKGAESFGSAFGSNLLNQFAGPMSELMEKLGVNFGGGMKGIGLAGGAALATGVFAGLELLKSDVKNVVNLVDTEFHAFGKVGTDAANTLMSGFKGAVSGQMPDVMSTFNVLEEATKTSLEVPFNILNTTIDSTVGHIPIIGDVFKSTLGVAEGAFDGLFGAFDEFKELSGEWLNTLIEVDERYTEIGRKIAASTLDPGQIERLTNATREIAASGEVANMDSVAAAIGRLNANIKGLSSDQLKELTITFAQAEEIAGHIDPTKFAGIINAFKIEPGDAAEELTKLVNAARATGISVDALTDEMIHSGPAMRQLGYDADQAASFFAEMTQKGEAGTALVRSMNTVVAKLAELVDKGTFKNVQDGWDHTIQAVKDYIKAGNDAAAIDMLKGLGAGRSAALIIEDVKSGVLDLGTAMKSLPNLATPLAEAEEKTRTLGEAWKIVGVQISAALQPIGSQLAHELSGASNAISNWIKNNQEKITGWGVDVTKVVVEGMAFVGTWMVNILASFGPVLDAFKNSVIVAVEYVIAPIEAVAKALAVLPGEMGKPFKDFVSKSETLKKELKKGWDFSLNDELDKVKKGADDFYNNTVPKIEHGLDDIKKHARWWNDPWFKTPGKPGAPSEGGGEGTGEGAGGGEGTGDGSGAAPPPLSSFPVPGSTTTTTTTTTTTGGPALAPPLAAPAPGGPFPFSGTPSRPGDAKLMAGSFPLGQVIDGIPMPAVPYNGMTLSQYRSWAAESTRYGQEGTKLGTEQQQAQADIGTRQRQYAKDYADAQALQARLDSMSQNDPTRGDVQEKLNKALDKLVESNKAVTDATDRLRNVNQQIADRDIKGPPEPPKPSDKSDKDAESLGGGLVKGIFQELGFPDVFGKAFTQFGSYKLGMGLLGDILSMFFPNGAGTGTPVAVTNWPTVSGTPLVPIPGPTADRPTYGGFPAIIPPGSQPPTFNGPPVHGGKPPDPLPGPLGGGKASTAAYIIQQAQARGFTPEQTQAILATGLQESGLDETARGGGGAWHGVFQQDASYPNRDDLAGNVNAFFDRLGPPTADIWKQIFRLQQGKDYNAPGARKGYMSEIQSRLGEAQGLYGQVAGSGSGPGFPQTAAFSAAPTDATSAGGGLNLSTIPLAAQKYANDCIDASARLILSHSGVNMTEDQLEGVIAPGGTIGSQAAGLNKLLPAGQFMAMEGSGGSQQAMYAAIKASIDKGVGSILNVAPGSSIAGRPFSEGHFIAVTGYNADGTLNLSDTARGDRYSVTAADAFQATRGRGIVVGTGSGPGATSGGGPSFPVAGYSPGGGNMLTALGGLGGFDFSPQGLAKLGWQKMVEAGIAKPGFLRPHADMPAAMKPVDVSQTPLSQTPVQAPISINFGGTNVVTPEGARVIGQAVQPHVVPPPAPQQMGGAGVPV